MPAVPDVPAGRWARRDVLRLVLTVPVLAGCSASPTVEPLPATSRGATAGSGATGRGTTTSPPDPSPAPAPEVPAAATAEQALSVHAAAVLDGPHRRDLDEGSRTLLAFLRDAHAEHALALAGDDPTSRPTTAAPSPTAAAPDLTGQGLAASLRRLAAAESAQATAQRRAATSASGLAALLAGSLAVAAETYAAALGSANPPGPAPAGVRTPAPLLSDVEASRQLVAQLHAVVYGYQLAIGKLRFAGSARGRALTELADARAQLDRQIAFLLSRRADVPAAEPAYAPSPDPRTPSDAGRLVRGMATRLEPYAGIALAAAGSTAARTDALALLRTTARRAGTWGAGLQVWPGWPD